MTLRPSAATSEAMHASASEGRRQPPTMPCSGFSRDERRRDCRPPPPPARHALDAHTFPDRPRAGITRVPLAHRLPAPRPP
ncbi:hypothetical protein ACFOPN_01665 [Xanthomonas hyacinthi]|uniref:hypothetical protein n=1 Tax=Xanthomonas hyacinthi TaxID=56455 RepID=UPI0036155BEF